MKRKERLGQNQNDPASFLFLFSFQFKSNNIGPKDHTDIPLLQKDEKGNCDFRADLYAKLYKNLI